MSSGYKKKAYAPWESLSKKADKQYEDIVTHKTYTDTSGNVLWSMKMSPAWKALDVSARELYASAKSMYNRGDDKTLKFPCDDFNEIEDFKRDVGKKNKKYFYLNRALMSDIFALYPKTDTKRLSHDVNQLIDCGFIEQYSNGRANHKKSIYYFSSKWQEIGLEEVEAIKAKWEDERKRKKQAREKEEV